MLNSNFSMKKIIKHSQKMNLDKAEIIKTFKKIIPEFYHVEKKYNLDQKNVNNAKCCNYC